MSSQVIKGCRRKKTNLIGGAKHDDHLVSSNMADYVELSDANIKTLLLIATVMYLKIIQYSNEHEYGENAILENKHHNFFVFIKPESDDDEKAYFTEYDDDRSYKARYKQLYRPRLKPKPTRNRNHRFGFWVEDEDPRLSSNDIIIGRYYSMRNIYQNIIKINEHSTV